MRLLEWNDFIGGAFADTALSLGIGVFDGVHRGHQALIQELTASEALPTIITFRQNPLQTLRKHDFSGNIYSLERKTGLLSAFGVKMTVLIDFSLKFSKLKGSEFIGLLLRSCRLGQLVLGRNFHCGCKLDTGIAEIAELAGRDTAIRTVEPVAERGAAISSSRIRSAIRAGNFAEAAHFLGRNAEIDLAGLPMEPVLSGTGRCLVYSAAEFRRILPPDGTYGVMAYGCTDAPENAANADIQAEGCVCQKREMVISVNKGKVIIPGNDGKGFNPVRLEFYEPYMPFSKLG